METINNDKVFNYIIAESNKSVYKLSKEYGSDLTNYGKRELRLDTLLKLCRLCGFAVVLVGKGKQCQIILNKETK